MPRPVRHWARARGSAASSAAVDYVGPLTTYRVDTDLGAIAVQEANDTPASAFEVGDRVVLEWAPDAAFVLPESARGAESRSPGVGRDPGACPGAARMARALPGLASGGALIRDDLGRLLTSSMATTTRCA